MANYLELLESSARERQSIACFGLDPVLELMPESLMQPREEKIVYFYTQIIDAALSEKQSISALKPNYAFFAQYGFDGLRALKTIIERYSGKLPIILDAKRGDIGKSSEAYANEVFNFWGADAVTVSPYMGYDSVLPFIERCKTGRGVYVLCRTSNEGAADFQSLRMENGKQLFYLGLRNVGIYNLTYRNTRGDLTVPVVFDDARNREIVSIIPRFKNEQALSDTTPEKRSVFNCGVYQVDQGNLTFIKDTLPIITTSENIVLKVSLNCDPNNEAAPALEAIELEYRDL